MSETVAHFSFSSSLSLLLIMCKRKWTENKHFKDQLERVLKKTTKKKSLHPEEKMMDVIKECLKKRHSETGEGPMEPRPPVTVSLLPPRGKHRHCNSSVDGGLTSLMDWWDGGCIMQHRPQNLQQRWEVGSAARHGPITMFPSDGSSSYSQHHNKIWAT